VVKRARDGSTWRIGTDAEVAWIANGTSVGLTITAAIPPVFEAYATVLLPFRGEGQDEHDRAVLALLSEESPGQPWWLGYLDTGSDDIAFPDAPKVTLYTGCITFWSKQAPSKPPPGARAGHGRSGKALCPT
jgi:hypothetical protein